MRSFAPRPSHWTLLASLVVAVSHSWPLESVEDSAWRPHSDQWFSAPAMETSSDSSSTRPLVAGHHERQAHGHKGGPVVSSQRTSEPSSRALARIVAARCPRARPLRGLVQEVWECALRSMFCSEKQMERPAMKINKEVAPC